LHCVRRASHLLTKMHMYAKSKDLKNMSKYEAIAVVYLFI